MSGKFKVLPAGFHAARAALPWVALAASVLALCLNRLWRVDAVEASYANCPGCLNAAVIAHDLLLAAPWLVLLAAAQWTRPFLWRGCLAAAAATLVFIYALDVVVLRLLNQRLLFTDLIKFGKEIRASLSVAVSLLYDRHGLFLLGMTIVAPLLTLYCAMIWQSQRKQWSLSLLLLAAASAVVAQAVDEPGYVLRESFWNVAEVNRPSGVDRDYSKAFSDRLRTSKPLPQTCAQAKGQALDVIVVVVESLSAYHSQAISGLWNVMPEMDALARIQGNYFTEFYANAFHTDGGLIATFAGRLPVPAINRYHSVEAFAGFDQASNGFYRRLRELGYHRAFLTNNALSFLGMGTWAKTLGFDEIEGSESAFYAGWPRGQFDAAEDRALFSRALDWYGSSNGKKPFFLGLLTTTSHPPFLVPNENRQNEQDTFRYVDIQLARFYRELKQHGFFDHGVLLVLGDHRSMTPLKPGEYKRYGESAFARVAAYVFGAVDLPRGAVAGRFQQTDVIPSVMALVDREVCRSSLQGEFLVTPPQPAKYVLHASGYERDHIQVFSAVDPANAIVLDGDRTRWLGLPPTEGTAILDTINRDRIERGAVNDNLLDFFIDLTTGQLP